MTDSEALELARKIVALIDYDIFKEYEEDPSQYADLVKLLVEQA